MIVEFISFLLKSWSHHCLILPYLISTLPFWPIKSTLLLLFISLSLPPLTDLSKVVISTFSIYWVITHNLTLTTSSKLAIIFVRQLADLINQDYPYSQKLHLSNWILIDIITNVSQKPDPLSLITTVLSQSEYNSTVWHLWNWMKEYQEAINFHQVLLDANMSEIKNKQHSHSHADVSTGQESISSNQSTSNQSEKRHPFSSTEEILHEESLCLKALQCQFSSTDMTNLLNQNDLQQLIQTAVWEAVAATLATNNQSNSLSLLGSQGSQELSEQDGNDAEGDNHHEFQSRNIEFLNSNFKLDSVEVKNNKQLYHNVFSFTNWVWVMTFTMNSATLQQNLQSCLLRKINHWYMEKLNHLSQLDLQNINDVKEWCKVLKSHFWDSPSWALALLEDIQYTVQDVWHHCDSVDYVQFIVLHEQNFSMVTTDTTQVRLVYKHMNDELCCDLPWSSDQFTISKVIKTLNKQKNVWFDIYTQNMMLNRSTQQQLQTYGRNCLFQLFNARFGEINQSRPFFYPDQFSYISYGNQFPNNNYGQWNNHQQKYQHNTAEESCQYSTPNSLLTPHQSLQIIFRNKRSSFELYQRMYLNVNCLLYDTENVTNSNAAKAPYCSYQYDCSYQSNCPSYSHTYHTQQDDGQSADKQEEYQAYKNAYYENNLMSTEKAIEEEKKHEAASLNENQSDNTINVNHIVKMSKLECWVCCQPFTSKNKLHKYLCSDCDYSKVMMKTTSSLTTLFIYIKSTAMNQLNSDGYEFQNWHYITVEVQLFSADTNQSTCLDIRCTMTLIDWNFLMKQTSHIVIHCMSSPILVQELSTTIHQSSQYIKISIYLSGKDCTAIIEWEIHIIKNLKIKMLLNMNILTPEDITMNLFRKVIIIGSCSNVEISLKITTKFTNSVSKAILVKQCTIILPWSNLTVAVIQPELSDDHNFLFKLNCQQTDASVYAHIVDHVMMEVHIHNDSNTSLIISQKSWMR